MNRRKFFGLGRSFLIAAALSALPVLAGVVPASADTLEKVRKEGKIRVGVGLFGTKPYVWKEGDQHKGFESELLEALVQKLGVKDYEYVVTEWATLIPGLKSNRWDIILSGMVKSEQRVQGGGISMSRPYFFAYDRLIVKDDSPLKSLGDMKGKVLGATMGSTDSMVAHSLVDRGLAKEVRDFNTFAEPFLALQNGQVDAVVFDQVTFLGQQSEMKNIKVVGEPLFYIPAPEWAKAQEKADYKLGGAAIGVRLEDKALLQAINDALDELDKEGTRKKIFEKYNVWDELQNREAMMK